MPQRGHVDDSTPRSLKARTLCTSGADADPVVPAPPLLLLLLLHPPWLVFPPAFPTEDAPVMLARPNGCVRPPRRPDPSVVRDGAETVPALSLSTNRERFAPGAARYELSPAARAVEHTMEGTLVSCTLCEEAAEMTASPLARGRPKLPTSATMTASGFFRLPYLIIFSLEPSLVGLSYRATAASARETWSAVSFDVSMLLRLA